MKHTELIKQILFLISLITLSFLLGWILKPNKDTSNELQLNKRIIELQYEGKIKQVENDYLRKIHIIENADVAALDSIWNNYGFVFDNL